MRLTNEQIGSLCGALAYLTGGGLGPGDALALLKEDEQDPELRRILGEMADRGDGGTPLAELFQDAGCFPGYVCTLLAVAQRVGQGEKTLASLAQYYQNRARMGRRVKAAVTYPLALLGVLLAVVVILLVWVLPVFNDVYAQLGSRLTGVAGVLLHLGDGLRRLLPGLCLVLAVLLTAGAVAPVRRGAAAFFKTRWGDRGILAQVNSARFVQALALGIQSGMTDREAGALASALGEGAGFPARCGRCMALLEQGEALPRALREAGFLSHSHCRLLEAGIRSGHGGQALDTIARELLESSEEGLEQALGKLEPAMVAVACGLIGAVLVSVMLPLVHIMNGIG